jgi:hypothetical protein
MSALHDQTPTIDFLLEGFPVHHLFANTKHDV